MNIANPAQGQDFQSNQMVSTMQMLENTDRCLAGGARIFEELGQIFTTAGYELYLVGGSIRDALLGKISDDLDFTTNAKPEEISQLLHSSTADAVWDTGIQFGTVSAHFRDYRIEITTYRADHYDRQSRKPAVNFGDNIDFDLQRRDFTINTIAMSVNSQGLHSLYDPLHGITALQNGIIDTPDDPEISFLDDPLRMLRALRFHAHLGFQLSERVQETILRLHAEIERISAERIMEETNKILLCPTPVAAIDAMCNLQLMDHFFPEIPNLKMTSDEHKQHKDVYTHSLTVLQQAIDLEDGEPDLILRWAALLHDIGKPDTKKVAKNGAVSFHHHEIVGAKMARRRLRTLKCPKNMIEEICLLISLHLRFYGYGTAQWTDSAVRRYVHDAGDQLQRLHKLVRADCTTRNKRKAQNLYDNYSNLEQRITELANQEDLDNIRPELNGEQIMQILQLSPGPQVGKAWKYLKELRLEQGEIGEEQAKAKLMEWWKQQNV